MKSTFQAMHNDFHIYRYKNGIKLLSPENKTNKDEEMLKTGLTVGELLNLPFCVYFSDPNTVNININHETIVSCGYDSYHDALNKSLYHVMDTPSVDNLIHQNKRIITSERTQILEEISLRKDDISVPTLSLKTPWYSKDDKIIGLLGLTIVLGKHSLLNSLKKIYQLNLISPSSLNILNEQALPRSVNDELFTDINLTQRQRDSIFYLTKGMTIKQIARKLNLAPKTIEHYLDNIKRKFKCKTRTELILKSNQFLSG